VVVTGGVEAKHLKGGSLKLRTLIIISDAFEKSPWKRSKKGGEGIKCSGEKGINGNLTTLFAADF